MAVTRNKSKERGISTEDWIKVARDTLIREGVGAVKVDRIAKKASVTRGGFTTASRIAPSCWIHFSRTGAPRTPNRG